MHVAEVKIFKPTPKRSNNCSELRVAQHNMAFVQECKQKTINERCYGGPALYNRQ